MSDDLHMQFCALVTELARQRKRSLNKLFGQQDEDVDGVSPHWMRDRYYGNTKVRPEDFIKMKIIVLGKSYINDQVGDPAGMQKAINAFCKACVGSDTACRFRRCELRAFSPYPYVKRKAGLEYE